MIGLSGCGGRARACGRPSRRCRPSRRGGAAGIGRRAAAGRRRRVPTRALERCRAGGGARGRRRRRSRSTLARARATVGRVGHRARRRPARARGRTACIASLIAADAVGDRVVELQDERRPAVGQALDDVRTPTAAGPGRSPAWRSARRGRARSRSCRRRRRCTAAEVVAEVEVRVDLPPGRRDRVRVADHPLAQAGDRRGWPARPCRANRLGSRAGRAATTAVIVERSSGSFSMVHMSASASLIRSSYRSSSAHAASARQQSLPSPGR